MDPVEVERAALARLQQQLLDALAGALPAGDVAAALQAQAADPAVRAWLAAFEPAFVAAARELLQRWGRR